MGSCSWLWRLKLVSLRSEVRIPLSSKVTDDGSHFQMKIRVPRLFSDDNIFDGRVSDWRISDGRISDKGIKHTFFPTCTQNIHYFRHSKCTLFLTPTPSGGAGGGSPLNNLGACLKGTPCGGAGGSSPLNDLKVPRVDTRRGSGGSSPLLGHLWLIILG